MNTEDGEIRRIMGDLVELDVEDVGPVVVQPMLEIDPKRHARENPWVKIRPAAVEGSRETHVVDEDALHSTLCGERWVYSGKLSSKRKTCEACRAEAQRRHEAGELTPPPRPNRKEAP